MVFVKKINGEYIVCWRNKIQSSHKGKRGRFGATKRIEVIRTGALVKFTGRGIGE